MSKYIQIIKWGIITIAVLLVIYFIYSYIGLKRDNERLTINNKALMEQYDIIDADNYELMFTLEEYDYYNDSLLERLKETQEELNIKDKELKSLQSINTTFVKYDTIVFNNYDTIFVEGVNIDTTIGDKYINTKLKLEYPNYVDIITQVRSEKDVLITQEKETINPPKKCWIGRLFQRKHYVIKVHVKEHNPYVINNDDLFIKIVD